MKHVKLLLQEAARAAHKSVSEFLLDAGIVAANQTLADRLRFELSPGKWDDEPVRKLAATDRVEMFDSEGAALNQFLQRFALVIPPKNQSRRHQK